MTLEPSEQQPHQEALEPFEEAMVSCSRQKLPATRASITHKFSVCGTEGYLIVGLYPDGKTPGELFIKVAKEGSTLGGLMDGIGILTSLALQHGTPLEVIVQKFKHSNFPPQGHTSNPNIGEVSSILDYIFRWMENTFVEDEGQ